MKTYLINLTYATERYENMQQQLATLGLPFEIIQAIDGKQIELPYPDYAQKSYQLMHGKKPSMGEIGCYFSHIKALKSLLASDQEHALILEDDAELSAAMPDLIAKAMCHQKHWDILRLSGFHSGLPIKIIALDTQHYLCVNLGKQGGSAAYVVNRRAAQNIIRYLLPMKLPFDHAFDREWLFACKTLFISPTPAQQGMGESYIWSLGIEKLPVYKRVTTGVYRLITELLRLFFRGMQALKLMWRK